MDGMSRREFLKRAGIIALAVPFSTSFLAACGRVATAVNSTGKAGSSGPYKLTWVSPRGTLKVEDDYAQTIALKMGYFKELNVDPNFQGGPLQATAATKMLVTNQADMAYPSPGVLATSVQAGEPIISVFDITESDSFVFMVRPNSPIKSIQDLAGKKIALGDAGWSVICDPIFKVNGINPKSVQYVAAGSDWGQTVQEGKADAALCWQGLVAQWKGVGLNLRPIEHLTPFPGNSYVVRKSDLQDPAKKQGIANFLKAIAMGLEWGKYNVRGISQLSLERFPSLKKQMTPKIAVESALEMVQVNDGPGVAAHGWGYHIPSSWAKYVTTLQELGQLNSSTNATDLYTNELIQEVNNFDHKRVQQDAANFKLSPEFASVKLSGLT